MNIPTDNGGIIDIQNERVIIPIYFGEKLDFEGMRDSFNECLEELDNHEEEVLKEFS